MKSPLLLLAVFGSITSFCEAYGQAGAGERILYYAAYLSEEVIGSGFTIGPGCVGGRELGRCTFDEFLHYIWAPFPEKGDVDPPRAAILGDKVKFETALLATLLQKTNDYKNVRPVKERPKPGDPPVPKRRPGDPKPPKVKLEQRPPITGNIDTAKLFPGASDYYDAMAKCGGVMRQMRTVYDGMPDNAPDGSPKKEQERVQEKKAYVKALLGRAKEASGLVVDFRAKQMDDNGIKCRIHELEAKLGFKMEMKQGRDSTGQARYYEVWDVSKTIKANPGKSTEILAAYREWYDDPDKNYSNRRHLTAFKSAKMAASSCGC